MVEWISGPYCFFGSEFPIPFRRGNIGFWNSQPRHSWPNSESAGLCKITFNLLREVPFGIRYPTLLHESQIGPVFRDRVRFAATYLGNDEMSASVRAEANAICALIG